MHMANVGITVFMILGIFYILHWLQDFFCLCILS